MIFDLSQYRGLFDTGMLFIDLPLSQVFILSESRPDHEVKAAGTGGSAPLDPQRVLDVSEAATKHLILVP
jgi:hypothetical protein